jgi:hypothetical protein
MPVPTPTSEAIAQYKAEEQSRSELGRFGKMMSTFHKAPDDLPRAAKVGEPTLVDPQQTSAPQLIHEAQTAALAAPDKDGNGTVSVEKATPDATKNDPIPRSEAAPSPNPEAAAPAAPAGSRGSSDTGIGELTPNATPAAQGGNASATQGANGASAATANTGNATGATDSASPQAPAQVNEIQNGGLGESSSASQNTSSAADQGSSSSKKKKKTGLKKIVPF